MKRVIVESPFAGDVQVNLLYARFACYDCLVNHDEAPFASHLLYTQEHILKDEVAKERELGINAGFEWREVAETTIFYIDLGMSRGMHLGKEHCQDNHESWISRRLPNPLWIEFQQACVFKNLTIPHR